MIDLSRFAGKCFYVVGLGTSGRSSVHALAAAGAKVLAWDDHKIHDPEIAGFNLFAPADVPYENLSALILSPGITLSHPSVDRAKAAGVAVISDVELAFRAGLRGRALGITGTNGKSTVTAMTAHVLETLGKSVSVGGNFGPPTLHMTDPGVEGFIVLELSSYQLDLSPGYPLAAACVLNLGVDHLDRHRTMAAYAATKARIFHSARQGFILGTDPWCQTMAEETGASLIPSEGWPTPENQTKAGPHQRQNYAAVAALLGAQGFAEADVLAALDTFPGLAHRQELLGQTPKWTFINDSKATNAGSAAMALMAYDRIHWLAGGKGKNGGLADLAPALTHVVKAYVYGENAPALGQLCQSHGVPFARFETLDAATKAALSDPIGGTLLLAPAAASWDQYPNFMARGDHFRDLIKPHLNKGPRA